MPALNAKQIEKLLRLGKPGLTNDGQGLYFKISKAGSASWIYRFKLDGRTRDMGLGKYPDISLAQAREKATDSRRKAQSGIDPISERQLEEQQAKTKRLEAEAPSLDFKRQSKEYIATHKASWKSAKHAQQWANTLSTYAYPVIGDLHPKDIHTAHLMSILTPIWGSKTETANRVRNRIELVLDAAKAQGLREGENPARWRGHLDKLLPKPSKVAKVKHHAAMPWEELPNFMKLISQKQGASFRAMEMTIMTACRTSEVLNAKWEEIDLPASTWTIPPERMKAGGEHRVPISKQLRGLLEALPRLSASPYVFPGARAGRPLSNMSMMMALRGLGFEHLTMHGFRSTFRDWAAECTNHSRDVCEQALAHSLGSQVEAAYRRGDLFSKRAILMQDWANYIEASSVQ
ncbi:integrase arm-type DNA-binding domain-containing protein [Halopseudomonas pachastrellae]|nr:integrase arm-type DNA-binding domain-containing protein [Halopseudomonas pachastrellae]